MTTVEIREVVPDDANQRLDRWLKRLFPSLNQIKIEKLCRKGEIRINGGRVKPSRRLASGETVRIPPLYHATPCLLYTSPSPRDGLLSRMPSSA